MRAAHVVPAIHDEASGPSYSVPRLCRALVDAGVETALHSVSVGGWRPPPDRFEMHLHPGLPGRLARRLLISPALSRALRQEARRAQVLHNHSLWVMPNVYPGYAVRGAPCKLVTSPRGVLDGWARRRSRWKKRALWLLGQRETLRRTDCFHATAESEWHSIREAGVHAPVAIIPNGIDIPPERSPRAPGGRRRLLFLGRLHEKKGIDVLLRAWAAVESGFGEWDLRIVGPDEGGYGQRMQALAADLRAPRVQFAGPVYGEAKRLELDAASLFVLPTHAENFGLAVAEALAAGVPAIVSHGAPWAGLEGERCGYWIEHGVDALEGALKGALALPEDALAEMGARGRAWMRRDFSWQRVGAEMAETYRWLTTGGPTPSFVRLT